RSRSNPPEPEIWSGRALNDLLTGIKNNQTSYSVQGPMIPLNQEDLTHITLTGGAAPGNIGIFKNGGKLTWPYVLKKSMFEDQRKDIDEASPKAVQSVISGGDPKPLEDLSRSVTDLRQTLKDNVKNMPPPEYISALK